MLKKLVESAVKRYFESLPDAKKTEIAVKIVSAVGLTDGFVKKMIDSASGDRVVTIYFSGGDMATISSGKAADNRGPGW